MQWKPDNLHDDRGRLDETVSKMADVKKEWVKSQVKIPDGPQR